MRGALITALTVVAMGCASHQSAKPAAPVAPIVAQDRSKAAVGDTAIARLQEAIAQMHSLQEDSAMKALAAQLRALSGSKKPKPDTLEASTANWPDRL